MKAAPIPNLTVKDYLAHEKGTGVKYEYHAGQFFALAGGSLQHGLLCGNAYAEIRKGLETKGSNCKPLNSILLSNCN